MFNSNEDSKEMNMKRESKAYSYKEQLEELQLRREIEEKKRREGKIKQVGCYLVINSRYFSKNQDGCFSV